ncbi:MAG: hypothetical protein CVU05_13710 [Bacteroidetes bacterium HGW-Bacteroidetes-21]|jgi:Ca-activated chloride channel family protein|nr:MAG: hypothetical protein CVU05_13710 [Bacteroidetes bacterium HGW-Bacteroidetes-21]
MKSFLVFTCSLFIYGFTLAQPDDIYYSPERKPKPLKDRKSYTPLKDRQPEAGKSLYFTAGPTNTFYDSESNDKEIYYYIFLQGQKYTPADNIENPSMNISFVIDRSGSMSGDKLNYAKKAVDFAIDMMGDNDYVSIVQYDDKIETVLEPTVVKDKEKIHKKVQEISSGGSTDLCGGMQKGLDYVKSSRDKISGNKSIHRVILLSDGLANTGIIKPEEITAISRNYYQENSVTISTVGVGSDYNEELMTKISIEGGGNYHFIDNPEKMPEIFEREFLDMKSLVAKNVILEITFPQDMVYFDKVFQYPYTQNGNKIRIKLTDFYAEQQKPILIKFRAKNIPGSEMDFRTKLTYMNVIEGDQLMTDEKSSVVTATANKKLIAEGIQADAHMGYTLMLSSEYLSKAQDECDKRNFETARQMVKKGMDIIDEHFYYVIPNPYLEDIYENLKKYKDEIKELETTKDPVTFRLIQKGSKHKAYKGSYKAVRFL